MDGRELLDVIRAKSRKDEHYLLRDHIKDTLERAVQIREFIIKNDDYINYNPIKSEKTFKNLAKALFLHDLGKIDYGFQREVFSSDEKDKNNPSDDWKKIQEFFTPSGKRYPKDFKIRDHEILSVIHTAVFLGNREEDKEIRTAILLHHYNKFFTEREQHITRIIDDYPQIKEYIDFLIEKKDLLEQIYRELIRHLKNEFENKENAKFIIDALNELESELNIKKLENLRDRLDKDNEYYGWGVSNILPLYELYEEKGEELYDFFVFLGLLRRCDYAASAGPGVEAEKPLSIVEEVMKDLPGNIKEALDISHKKMWQEEIIERYRNNEDLILIAPTGSGKTEFALLWAREKGKKLLYTLPLRVALNDLYKRFAGSDGVKGEKGYFHKEYVDLLHSTAFIEYLKGEDISVPEKLKEVRMFASPMLLTTPDQVFLSSLKFYGFDKLLSIYPLSTIVIDEIQAYDPEMAAIIIKTLEMVKKVYGNILIITATFPPYFKEFLHTGRKTELKIPIADLKKEKEKMSQKAIEIKNYDLKRHKLKIVEGPLVAEKPKENGKSSQSDVKINGNIMEIIDDNSGKNVLIIANTVMDAVKIFENLKECRNKRNVAFVELLHSRLVEIEKSRRIAKIKEFLNKKKRGEIPKNERIIVVATQIVEASVDFDFDILITEISPIDSQVQRWGRVYRNREDNYDEETPNIYIFDEISRGTKAIYRPLEVLEETLKALKEIEKHEEVLNYEKERELVEKIYSSEKIKEKYEKEIEDTLKWLEIYQASKRSEAQRIFRRIAGVQLVIPQIMREDMQAREDINKEDSEKLKKLVEMLERGEYRDSWKDITKGILGTEDITETKLNYEKLKILRWMYEYSIPIPEYALNGYLEKRPYEFLGFYVLNIKPEKAKIEEINKYGIDILRGKDLDEWIDEKTRFM